MKNLLLSLALIALTASAQTNSPATNSPAPIRALKSVKEAVTPTSEPVFAAHEFDLDLAGLYTVGEPRGFDHVLRQNVRSGTWGVDVGATYFFTRNLGLGAELGVTDILNPGPRVLGNAAVTATLRFPFGPVAPYVNAGGTVNFHDGSYGIVAGPGVEFRFAKSAGLFTDVRYTWHEHTGGDALVGRAGIRFAFW